MVQKQQRPNEQKKRQRYWDKRRVMVAVLALVMALLMILPMLTMVLGNGAQAATESELRNQISGLKNEASEMAGKKDELKSQLAQVKGQKDQALAEKKIRDQELAYLDAEIANTEQQIAYYELLIEQEQANLAVAKDKEQAQYELFCKRARSMEETGSTSYWSILFYASSFSELLSRAVDIQDIMDYDNAVIEQLKADRQAVADSLAALEATQAEQEAQKATLAAQRDEQAIKVAEAAQVLKNAESDVAAVQKLLDEQAAEEERVNAAIAKKQKELEEQIRQNQIKFAVSGDYIYPLPTSCMTLTSAFGYRIHPITNRPHSHTGIDIAAPYATKIGTVKSGVVTISEYGSSYGNYVVISHGDGTSSLYAHMSKRNATVGQVVNQGDVIGYVGSTGNSTGNHLHLEVRVNGSRIDPESLYPGMPFYRKYNE